MLGPLDYIFWVCNFLLQIYIVARSLYCRDFLRYFSINVFMLTCALTSVGQFFFLSTFGYRSNEYGYFYWYSTAITTVVLFLAILSLYHRVFEEMAVSKYIRGGALLLIVLTAGFSYLVIDSNNRSFNFLNSLVIEITQNLNFIGLVLTYLLWFAVKQMKESRLRVLQLVLSLGIYFAAYAALFAFANMTISHPDWLPETTVDTIVRVMGAFRNLFLPLAWAYTFTRIPEEARLATARVAAAHR